MAKLKVLTTAAIATHKEQLANSQRLDEYRTAAACQFLKDSDFLLSPVEAGDVIPPLTMTVAEGSKRSTTDFENSVQVFAWLSSLKPIYAADPRLWSALTHGPFWNYARWRYPKLDGVKSAATYLRTHWFVEGEGLAALRRNVIARLWWAAYLTVAPWDDDADLGCFTHADRFKYTRILLSSQQVFQDVVEREFGSNPRMRICFLDAFDQHRRAVVSPDRLMKASVRDITMMLEYRHLLTLPVTEMHAICMEVMARASGRLALNGNEAQGEDEVVDD